ncbi:MAG: hypothetical protein AAGD38_17705 [Acidobacteriota bacterium]
MTQSKWTWLRAVPWDKVVERVPDLLDAAKASVQGASDDRRQEALESRISDLEHYERDQSRLVADLTDQLSALTAEIDNVRRRAATVQWIAIGASVVAVAALIVGFVV